jgi:hypothetical protein
MFYEAIHQRLKEYTDAREQVLMLGDACSDQQSKMVRDMLIALIFLILIYLALFMLFIFYAFKCALKKGWSMYIPILLILGAMIPKIGGIIMVGVIVYGSLVCGSICEVHNDLRRNLRE